MNDLKLLIAEENRLDSLKQRVELIAFDTNMSCVYVSDHEQIYQIDNQTNETRLVFDLTAENVSNSTDNKLIMFHFLTESNLISVANEAGDLNLINVLSCEVEGVGSIADGLSAAQWSPDQELLALVTKTNAIILMTKDFDIVNEKKLSIENQVEASFVNVGWGSYETQFKGSIGKNAAKDKTEDSLLAWDDRAARICWRYDGEYFVVHFVYEATNSRKFQVFNREGAVHSNIETNVNVLDAPIAWKCAKSSLITASIQRFNKHEIIFFERNGLAHGGFVLPFAHGKMKVKSLGWNLDSSILFVWSETVVDGSDSEPQSLVQLWTTSNYYWYLKQSYTFNSANKITLVNWDPEDSYKLHLFTSSGQYLYYKLSWTVNYCKPVADYNGSIAVIDSSNALVTPFKNKVIPPPMSLFKVNSENRSINKVIWSCFNMDLILLTSNLDLVVYRYAKLKDEMQNGLKLGTYGYEKVGETRFEATGMKTYNSSVQHLVWTRPNQLVSIVDADQGFKLVNYEISADKDTLALKQISEAMLEYKPFNMDFNTKTAHLAIQDTHGRVYKYRESNGQWNLLESDFKFTQACPNFNLHSVGDKEICVGLSQYYRLYMDKLEISNNCNSYYLHDDFLLLTDHTNILKFVQLNKLNDSSSKRLVLEESSMRRVERGGKILIALHSDTGCILQMPRGNIELIHPRTLVVSKLKVDIENLKYLSVVETMRKHRVNMNLVYDHDPKRFIEHLNEFVSQVNSPNLINLFLTELSDEDTTYSFFKDHYPEKQAKKSEQTGTVKNKKKIGEICTNLISICQKLDSAKYFLVILSCYAKMKEIDKALFEINQSKGKSNSAVDEGLRHLLYIVDVNELFDVALGTYDFDLVLMVAEKSQKDPKEYLPFLNELKKLEENYRKYKIDLYLKRYKKALPSIVKCGGQKEEELVKLVNDFKLYSEALKYFKPGDELFKRISKLFAAHLNEKKYYEEAGLVLFRAELYQESIDLFLKSLGWQMFINACLKLQYPTNVFLEKLNQLIEKLKIENKHLEAAKVYEGYLNDPENAIIEFISGYHWFEAISCIHRFNRFDFLETNLIPSLKTHRVDLIKAIEQYESKFNENKERLEKVREEMAQRREKELENELDEDLGRNVNDNMSVSEMSASSVDNESVTGKSVASTVNTQFSNKSKKRRQKKSIISLKKGSAYEDLALIQELSETISYVYRLKDSIHSVSKALLVFNMNELCIELQTKYESIIDLIEQEKGTIWNYPTQPEDSATNRFNLVSSESIKTDFSKLDTKFRHPPEASSKRAWKLHFYE